MFKVISAISEKGGLYNEDAFVYSDTYFVVIDGATGLNGIHLTPGPTDAAWLAGRLAQLLKEKLPDTDAPVPGILKSAAAILKRELDALGYDRYEKAYPSACVSVARVREDLLECFTLGDAPVFVFMNDQTVCCLHDDSVARRDARVIDEMIKIHQCTGCTVAEALVQVQDHLKKNRQEMNRHGAYYIFEPTGQGIDHMQAKTFLLSDILSAALMTDGFYAVLSTYGLVKDQRGFMRALNEGQAEKLLNELKTRSFQDPGLNRYPRFKIMDDATILFAAKGGALGAVPQ